MSTMQRITLMGLYNHDNTLFDAMTLPEGYDKDILIDTLLLEHGEKCVLYPNPEFMKFSIGAVSRKWELELERIYQALTAEYNPIWNYDRNEEWEDHAGRKWGEKDEADYNNTRTPTLTELTEYGKKNTHEQLTNGFTQQDENNLAYTQQDENNLAYTRQDSDDLAFTRQDGNDLAFTQQDDNKLAFTQQDENRLAYTEQDSNHLAFNQQTNANAGTTEEQVSAFNSSNYEPSKKTITSSGKTESSVGKVNSSAGKIETSVGKVESSVGTVETSVGTVETSVGRVESSVGKVETSDGKTQDELSGKDRITTTGSDNTNVKGTLSDKNGSETNNSSHKGHLWGNIGITTATQMTTEVVEQRLKTNLYGAAAQIFANELLLMIY